MHVTGKINDLLYFFFILILFLGCVQRLPDLAMLTQSSQRVRHCNDTERRVSVS